MPRFRHTFTSSLSLRWTDMHLKRFKRETVKEALRAVREELGPDALILSTRVVSAPGMPVRIRRSCVSFMQPPLMPGAPGKPNMGM